MIGDYAKPAIRFASVRHLGLRRREGALGIEVINGEAMGVVKAVTRCKFGETELGRVDAHDLGAYPLRPPQTLVVVRVHPQ